MKKIFFLAFSICINFVFAQTEPTSQPTNLNFSGVKTYKASATFTGVAQSRYLAVLSESPITFTPTDNVEYIKGQNVNGAKVVYVGTSTFVGFKNLLQNHTYYLAVFAYNQLGNNINYKNDSPLTGSITTPKASYGVYYNNIDFAASDVINQLTNKIQSHTLLDYGQFDENVVRNIIEKDTVVNGELKSYIECQYSKEIKVYDYEDFVYQDFQPYYTREHRMAKSWYNFTGGNASAQTALPEGTDYHSLALVQGEVNTNRSNHPFGNVVNSTYDYLEYSQGYDAASNGTLVAEPRDDRKGDVARANLYIMLAYNGKYSQNWGLDNLISDAYKQDIQVLLDWHNADLPDDFEKTRHEYVAEIQGNRNPLIDFPELVDCIDFTDMTKKANCNIQIETGITNNTVSEFGAFVYPNPSKGLVVIKDIKLKEINNIHIYNLLGAEQQNLQSNNDNIKMKNLTKDYYIISIQGKKKTYISKILLK